jgi:glycine/D-amino acid oxidase-like deaminating enzyme
MTNTGDFPFKPSFWAPTDIEPQNSLGSAEIKADLVVVGGGYAGMSCAYYAKKARPELEVVLLESEYIGYGPSGRNFGAVAPGVREVRSMLALPDMEEDRFAVQWYLSQREELERRIEDGGIECEYRDEPLLMQALDEEAWEALQREAEILREKGTPHKLLDTEAMRSAMSLPYEPVGGLVRTAWRATQPFKLARGLGDQLRRMGVTIHEGTRVENIEDSDAGVKVTTADGGLVRANKAVLATGAYTKHLPGFAEMIFPRHTHVIATEVLDKATFDSLGFNEYKFVDDSGFAFYYARVYQGRLLFGGGEPTTGLFEASTVDYDADNKQVEFARVYQEMVTRFPKLENVEIEAAWGGPVDMTDNFAPMIKEADGMPNVTVCMGYNGEGLLAANVSGKLALGLILGPDFADPNAERVRQYLLRDLD